MHSYRLSEIFHIDNKINSQENRQMYENLIGQFQNVHFNLWNNI